MQVRRLDTNHDMTFGQGRANIAQNQEATAQRVKTRLYLLRSEWFLDTDAGVPYLQRITTKPADLFYAESVIKQTILGTEGVDQITEFGLTFNRETRKLSVAVSVSNIYGSISNIRTDL